MKIYMSYFILVDFWKSRPFTLKFGSHAPKGMLKKTCAFFSGSRWQMLLKIGVLKNLVNFTGKHLCSSFFLIKLQAHRKTLVLEFLFNTVASLRPTTLLKRNSNTGVFLWNLLNLRTPFLRNKSGDCFQFFMKLFASKDCCLFLHISTNQKLS